ncbi:MAG TPA: hypothetical protein EYP68_05185 [Candidatus Korarchaeota archaeon]|nr:hypothetical protein [Candidatus Korarchaeota archaeon]
MTSAEKPKYEVPVIKLERALRTKKEVREKVKEMLGGGVVRKFNKDAVDCPVRGKRVSFLECYICPNFIRRFKGTVHCRGRSIPISSAKG